MIHLVQIGRNSSSRPTASGSAAPRRRGHQYLAVYTSYRFPWSGIERGMSTVQ